MANMKYLLNFRSFIPLMVLFSFFDNFGTNTYNSYLIKIAFVGDAAVGKTQIVNRYMKNSFENGYNATVSGEFTTKEVEFKNKKRKLQVWDTAGQDSYRSIIKDYYKNSQLIAFVYDISTRDSFNSILNYWVEDVTTNTNEKPKFLLIGNKCDLEDKRQVTKEEAKKYAEDNNMKFIEVSAKTREGIDNMFKYIISKVLKDENNIKNEKISNQDIDSIKNKKTSFCDEYCFCCPWLKNEEQEDSEEDE